MLQKHISRERLNRRFCIDCKYHKESRSVALGPWCTFELSPVDNEPKDYCYLSRASSHQCTPQGKNFALSSDTVIHETEEQVSAAKLKEPLMVVIRFLKKLKNLLT